MDPSYNGYPEGTQPLLPPEGTQRAAPGAHPVQVTLQVVTKLTLGRLQRVCVCVCVCVIKQQCLRSNSDSGDHAARVN